MLLLAALAVPAGIVSALMAKFLLWLIAVITNFVFFQHYSAVLGSLEHHRLGAWVILAPAASAMVVGLMARFGSDKIRGHGIPEAIEAILLGKSLINPKVAILKPISSAISIGTGGPFGAEGPIIMTGGGVRLDAGAVVSSDRGGAQNAARGRRGGRHVGGVQFSHRGDSARGGTSAVRVEATQLCAGSCGFHCRCGDAHSALGRGAGLWHCCPWRDHGVAYRHRACLVGVLGGFASCALTTLVYFCEDLFERLPMHWMWWPAIGGLVVGVIGWLDPRVLGVGYESIHALLLGSLLGKAVLILLVTKSVVWAVSLSSGTSGGVLAPLLIVGASLGARCSPNGCPLAMPVSGPWLEWRRSWAARCAPRLPAPFFIMEMTHDYNSLPLLVCSSMAALVVTVLVLPRSILTEKLARRGQHIACEFSVDPFDLVRVGDVMDRELPAAPASMNLRELIRAVAEEGTPLSHRQGTILLDAAGKLAGILTRGDLVRAIEAHPEGEIPVSTLTRRESHHRLLRRNPQRSALHDAPERRRPPCPLKSTREDPGTPLGYLGRSSILSARERYHTEEEVRERGFIFGVGSNLAARLGLISPIGGIGPIPTARFDSSG